MPHPIDLTGQTFGRLTVIKSTGQSPGGNFLWECKCQCGKIKVILSASLRGGRTKSCGCYSSDLTIAKNKTHGLFGTPEYVSWAGMKYRCLTTSCKRYKDYGGRGIKVCERWLKFENFLEDMGNKPSLDMGIERTDNDGNYEPSNCKWGTEEEQQNNKRSSLVIEFNGRKQTMAQWAKELGMKYETLWCRIKDYEWSIDRAMTTPVKNNVR